MARKVIDVGLANNDGTGDSIRDSFKKVNDNFQELYSSLGLGDRLTFSGLGDTPGSYLNQQGKLLVVNQTQDGLEYRSLVAGTSLAIDYDNVNGTITLRPLNQDLVNDITPQLGGDLNARSGGTSYKIFNLPAPSGPTDAANKAYVDTKISLAGVDATDPETGLTNASFGTMTGALVLSRNPTTADDDDYDGLIAATKRYVDRASFVSTTSLYVNLGGSDFRTDLSEDRQGRSQAFAFRTLEKALKECERIIADSPFELSVYKKKLVYNGGIPCTLTKIETAQIEDINNLGSYLPAGSGALIIPRMSVETFTLKNAGTGYVAGDVLQMGLPSSPGTFSSRASISVLRVSNVNGAILTFQIIGRGNYTALPGVLDVGTTLSVAGQGSVGAGATFDLTYVVAELSITQQGSGYGPVSIRIDGGGGGGAAASAIVSNGAVIGTTLLSGGGGYTATPTVQVLLPRLFVFTNGARTDFSSSLDPLARDIREGLGLRGMTSGAIAEILAHDSALDDASTGYPSGTGKNELFDVGVLSGWFIDGEELEYGELIKTKQITVQVESGVFEENFPLRVSNNVSIIGEEFRRTLIRPKIGVSTSPYTQIFFRRDPIIDNLRVTGLFGINLATDTTATPSARSGTITVTLGSAGTNTNWIGKIWKTIPTRGEGVITEIVSSTQFKVKIHKPLDSTTEITQGAVFVGTISGTTLTVSSVSSGTITVGMEVNEINLTNIPIGISIVSQLTGVTGAVGTYRLNKGTKIAASTSMFGSNWQIYTVNEYGYHYLTDPSKPIYPLIENSGRNINASTLLRLNKFFIQEEVTAFVDRTYTVSGYDQNVNLIIDAIVYDLVYGGYSRSVETALKYYQTANGIASIGLTGTPEAGFIDIVSNSPKAATIGAISYAATLADQVVRNNAVVRFNTTADAEQIINFSLTREPAATGTISALMNTIIQMLDDPRNVNFPKDNRELDVFLCNDANILRQITIQGQGGFAQVLDPEGQILNKSPYSQQGSVFSASTNQQRFAGGMFIDGYTGNQYFRIRSKQTVGVETNFVFEVDKLFRRPQLPCTFVVLGVTYKVNYLRNFVFSTGVNGSSATLVLDSSTPYTDTVAGIITGCTASGDGTHATVTFPSVRGTVPYVVGNQIDVSGFGGDAEGYNGVWVVIECTTAFVKFVSGETDPGVGGTVAENFELITAGYRSLLSNDWTQLNDMGYGLFVTNGGISEAVGMFTYYCYNAYYSLNGGQIRSVGGSAAHGIYALRAEGSDPKEIPDDITVGRDFINSVQVYAIGQYGNARGDNELYVNNFSYEPLADSVIEVLHYRNDTAKNGLEITGMTQNGLKTVLTVAGADSFFQARENIQISGIDSSSGFADIFNYQKTVSGSFPGVFRIDSVNTTTITLDFVSTGATGFAGITVTGGSWTAGTATLTFASQTVNPYVTGQKVVISGVTPSGYNNSGTAVTITAVTPTSISYAVADPGGAWASGGVLAPMVRVTGVKREYSINSLFYGDGSSEGGIPDGTARLFLEPVTTDPGETGLYASISNGSPVTIRQVRKLWINGVSNNSAAKASTALLFDDDDPDLDVNDVITYSTGDLANRTGGNEEAFANLREGYRYIQVTATLNQRNVGNQYYGAVGSTNISVTTVTEQVDILKMRTGNYAFHWFGVEYIVTDYTVDAPGVLAYITLNKPLEHPVAGYSSATSLLIGPKAGVTGAITIKISTLRATAFDLLDIGSGSYADTNYPNNIFGPSVNTNKPENEAAEVGKGRIFFTTIDQEGNFKVGKLFGVNQSTGEASLSARISLSNIASLQLSQGVPINEFTADPNFSSPSSRAVATELATKLYIDRRLGHDGADRLATDRLGPGFIDTSGKNFMVDNFNMGNAGRIINMLNPTADDDAVNFRWLSLPHLNGNNGSITIPNCTVTGSGTVATVTFGLVPTFTSAPFVAGQIIGITGFTTSGFNGNRIVVATCTTTGLTYASTAAGTAVAGGIVSSSAKGNLLVYTGANTTDVNQTVVAKEGFTSATVTGDIEVTLDESLRTVNFQLVNETIINSDISQTAAIEQKKLNLSNTVATTNSSLSVTATASGNVVTLQYASQADSITGLTVVPFAAETRVIVSGFANAALNGTFTVKSVSPSPTAASLGYDCPALGGAAISTPVTGGTVQAEKGVSTFNTTNFTVNNGYVNVKDNGLQLSKLVKITNDRVIGYIGGDATGNAAEVPLNEIASRGGAVLLNQYNSVGVLFASVGGVSTTPTRAQMRVLFANHNVVGPGGTAAAVLGPDSESSVRNLVARDTNGDTDLRNLKLEGSLRMSRPGNTSLGSDTEYTIADLAAVTNGKSTVIYSPGSAANRGSIVLSVSDTGDASDYNLYKNRQHRFQNRAGSYGAQLITTYISTSEDLAVNTTSGVINGRWTLAGSSSFEATYADLAEYYEGDKEYEVGTVVVFGGDKEVTTTTTRADHRVAGIVSNTAAYTMNQACPGIKVLIALQGRVPVKVVGKVEKGDLLVTSSIPGVAISAKGVANTGTLIGKAIGSYDSDHIGTVEVSVGRT